MTFLGPNGQTIPSGKLVVGQSYRISAVVGVNITGATSVQIGYRKPGAITFAYWTAVVDVATTGAIHYDVTAAQNDTPGSWTAWYKIVQADAKVLEIPAQSYLVLAEGSPV